MRNSVSVRHAPSSSLLQSMLGLFGELRGHVRARVDESAQREQIRRITTEIAACAQDSGRRFEHLSTALDPISHHAEKLVAQCETLLNQASGHEEGQTLFQSAVSVLGSPLACVDRYLAQKGDQLSQLEQAEERIRELFKLQHDMRSALQPLTYMVVLFRIESAGLDAEQQGTFVTVAAEIQRLRELVDRTFEENIGLIEQARTTVSTVRGNLSNDYESHGRFVAAKRGNIDHAIARLDEQLATNEKHDLQLREIGRSLQAEIGQLVLSLQTQDILQQRCDHIREALLAPGEVRLGPLAGLQSIQLRETAKELRDSTGRLRTALQRIQTLATDLNESSVRLPQFKSTTAAADGMVQLLLDTFQEITEIIDSSSRLSDDSHTRVAPVMSLARNLTSQTSEISLNIRMIALNAQVRSVQIGTGSGLEVLAARTAEISRQLSELGENTNGEISAFQASVGAFLSVLEEFRTASHAESEKLGTAGATIEQRLHALRDTTLTTLQAIAVSVQEVNQLVASGAIDFDGIERTADELDGLAGRLETIAADNPARAKDIKRLAAHATRYSMAAERHVHALATGHSVGESRVTQSGPELFVDAPVEELSVAAPEVSPSPRVAPLAPPSATSTPSRTAAVPAALDDNVELF